MAQRKTPGKTLNLIITSLNEYGYGVGQKAGQTITVAKTAPGDSVLTSPPKSSEKWTSAELIKVLQAGADRVPSGCKAFDQGCGGCQWLHLSYTAQLSWKEKNLTSLMRTRAGFKGRIQPIVGMDTTRSPLPCDYRNKLSLKNTGGKLLFVPETDDSPLAPAHCLVQTPALQKAWLALKTMKVAASIEQIHLRSNAEGQVGIHAFVTEGVQEAQLQSLFASTPGAIGLGVTTRKGYRHAAGEASLAQAIDGTTWLIPHNGFFQTNQMQAGKLLELVRQEARMTKADRVLDLYCGAGFFGLALAKGAKEIIGIEENQQAVEAAGASALRSGITNSTFLAGDMGKVLAELEKKPGEIAIIDPPREGLLPKAIQALIARAPKRLIYISCYPPSLVRDFKLLNAAGWKGVSCTPVDMFPHTSHLETIVTLER